MNFRKRSTSSIVFDWFNNIFMLLLCACMLLPFWFVITGSFASETEFLRTGGLIFINKEISLETYSFLFSEGTIFKSMALSIIRLALVVPYSLVLTTLLAYVISHEDLPGMKCPWAEDLADAKRVAVKLGLDFEVWDFEEAYKEKVVDYMLKEFQAGRTPNPDIMCNQEIKFKLF